MVTMSNTNLSFSQIQSVLGGVSPISLSEYFLNASSGYAAGMTGVPNIGSVISVSHFSGKAKPVSTPTVTVPTSGTSTVYLASGAATTWELFSFTMPSGVTTMRIKLDIIPLNGSFQSQESAGLYYNRIYTDVQVRDKNNTATVYANVPSDQIIGGRPVVNFYSALAAGSVTASLTQDTLSPTINRILTLPAAGTTVQVIHNHTNVWPAGANYARFENAAVTIT